MKFRGVMDVVTTLLPAQPAALPHCLVRRQRRWAAWPSTTRAAPSDLQLAANLRGAPT
jgi:hypothetical protein